MLIAGLNRERALAAADDLIQRGFTAVGFGVDVGQEDQIRDLVAEAVRSFGRLDILHNAAALTSPDVIGRDLELADLDPALFEQVLRINVIGYALGAKYAIP